MPGEIQVAVPRLAEILHLEATTTVGRADSNDIVIEDDRVSGEHLEIRRVGDGWEIHDVGSTNGTFIGGERVRRRRLGHMTRVRLGHPTGPELLLKIPDLAGAAQTRFVEADEIADRYLGETDPDEMSERTRVLRAKLHERHEADTRAWTGRTRRLQMAVGALLVLSIGLGGLAVLQRRAQRRAAAELFHTIKALELDLRRVTATADPDPELEARMSRLEDQYEDLLTTLGIYSERTPEEVRLIYRVIHNLGESEANVPRAFVDEVLRYVEGWNGADLRVALERADEGGLDSVVAGTLLSHNLPPEFFYLPLVESKLDPRAIGPSTRFGVAKGLWQFIPPTAEAYGLRVGPLQGQRRYDPLDERHDVEKATSAAARYLYDIYTTDAQASGLLVMAAYNWGEPNVLRLIRSMPESPAERNFWTLLELHGDRLPDETYAYVFRIVSAAVIGADPGLFGYDFEPPLQGVQ